MSKFGENMDQILEILQNREYVDLTELRVTLPYSNLAIINFMNEFGLIEFNGRNVRITKSGKEFLET